MGNECRIEKWLCNLDSKEQGTKTFFRIRGPLEINSSGLLHVARLLLSALFFAAFCLLPSAFCLLPSALLVLSNEVINHGAFDFHRLTGKFGRGKLGLTSG